MSDFILFFRRIGRTFEDSFCLSCSVVFFLSLRLLCYFTWKQVYFGYFSYLLILYRLQIEFFFNSLELFSNFWNSPPLNETIEIFIIFISLFIFKFRVWRVWACDVRWIGKKSVYFENRPVAMIWHRSDIILLDPDSYIFI